MPYDKTGDDGRFEATYSPEEFLDAVDRLDFPTTSDVADAVDCAHRTALHHLNDLEDSGDLDSRMAGRAKIWSVKTSTETASERRETEPSPEPEETSAGGRLTDEAIRDAVESAADTWDDDADRVEARKDAARATLEYLREHGGISKQEAKENVEPDHSVDGQNARTWYRKNARPAINAVAEYDNSERKYILGDE